MPFKKGASGNPNGKVPGTVTQKTKTWTTFADYCMNGGLEKFKKEFEGLKGKQFVDAFLTLLEYHKPKLQRTTVVGDEQNPIQLNASVDVTKLSDGALKELASLISASSEAGNGEEKAS